MADNRRPKAFPKRPRLRGLRRRRRKPGRQRRPINLLASVMTTFNLYWGLASMFASINGEIEKAAYYIFISMVFDALDGTVARITNSVSAFGKELDSLCDIVSFGVAPAMLIYNGYLLQSHDPQSALSLAGSMVAIVYVICGALRLARYNVFQAERRDSFVGLPIPAAAGTVASFALFTNYLDLNVEWWIFDPLLLLLAFLMVSQVRYPKDRLRRILLPPRKAFRVLVVCVLGLAAFHYARERSIALILLPLALTYLGFGIADTLYGKIRYSRRGDADEAPSEPSAESSGDPKG
jgi:CDP-diacylglycerol---serine O-phosphatidyltransferase